jgi:hypothetical protein
MKVLLHILTCSMIMAGIDRACADEPLVDANPAAHFCDKGYFDVGGQVMTFSEIIIEGNRAFELNEKGPITVFGYIYDAKIAKDPMDATRAKLFGEGKCWRSSKNATADYMTQVDLLFEPFEFSDSDYKKIRMELLKVGDLLGSKALIKVTGQFKNYSNTFDPYFSAKSLEIIDMPE